MEEPPMDLWEPPSDPYPPVQAPPLREVPQKKPEPPQPTPRRVAPPPPPPPSQPAQPAGQRVLRPIKTWTEVVDRVRDTSRMAASFLISAKAYTTEGGQVVVKLESDFIRTMVSREGAPEALRAALAVCLSRKLEERDILYEVEESKGGDASLIDLIIEAAEESE